MKCEQPKRFFQESRKNSRYLQSLTKINNKGKNLGMPFDSPVRAYSRNRRQEYNDHYYPYPYTPGSVQCKPDDQLEENESWACDHCRVATFKTYREACEHEQVCPFNQANQSKALHSLSNTSRHFQVPQNISRYFAPPQTPRLLLSMPSDKQSLSDRQCYVRSHFVEVFEAGDAEVDARHSKGAQKLKKGQIGIRCLHCVHLFGKARAERATCYPSSVSRIYQTVADMQRFHFEACVGIPAEMKAIYKSLKTTRPRGQGSPQSYWISSAKAIGLVDTESGIRLQRSVATVNHEKYPHLASPASSSSSVSGQTPIPSSPTTRPYLPHLSPGSNLTASMSSDCSMNSTGSMSDQAMSDRESDQQDASMLLALRGAHEKMCP